MSALAERIISHDRKRREQVAMRDPKFAEIETRRHHDGSGTIMFSDTDNLGWDEWNYQSSIRDTIPARWWIPTAHLIARRPIRNATRASWRTIQRARRGWDDTAIWNLDRHLCKTLAAQLHTLAATTSGWPDGRWETADDWKRELHQTACDLERYATRDDTDLQNAYLDALCHGDEETRDTARAAAVCEEETLIANGKAALHWVADNLPHLWD